MWPPAADDAFSARGMKRRKARPAATGARHAGKFCAGDEQESTTEGPAVRGNVAMPMV